ncbi:50S ribosomal protein L22 [Candidatus Parcubacteria bacterium]|nr:50S ribosomal protein L22 [Candidatus Parcubacteria bacterium]
MNITAKLRYLHIAPRKVRLMVDLIRGKSVEQAQRILNFTPNRSSEPLLKLLKSSIANAKDNLQLEEDNLYISKIFVDEGPKLKRWHAQSRGRAAEIQKKSSHISLELSEIKKKKVKKVKKTEKKVVDEKIEKEEKTTVKPEQPKPKDTKEKYVPKITQGMKRVFRRKAF